MERVDLENIFLAIEGESYCCLKSIFWYTKGGDIDIFCDNMQRIAQKIIKASKGHTIKFRTKKYRAQIDFMDGDKLELKFDLYERSKEPWNEGFLSKILFSQSASEYYG